MNVLWIMCDQLRHDYLGCAGHPHIKTPNFDRVAANGVRFNQAFTQSPVCGPSRMSAYTGRYVRSHGATTNESPLRIGEPALGDHLANAGVDTVLIGKTHMVPDTIGMERLGIDPDSAAGQRAAQCGFRPYVRDDGLYPNPTGSGPDYFDYLRRHGIEDENPWENLANAAEGPGGCIHSGWFMQNADKPARIPAHLSESAYITDRALEFIENAPSSQPWVAHVSYIKPHWPYIAPAPYHDMYSVSHVLHPSRSLEEQTGDHPVYGSFIQERVSKAFCRDIVRNTVIPTYMGLITQVDDQLGRILDCLEETGQDKSTMIILSSDHGDYLGDHWLGEKQLFHDPSVRVPLIIKDPRPEANATRGTVTETLAELVDLAPTITDIYLEGNKSHIFEGESLLPVLHEGKETLRRYAISELDYSEDTTRRRLKHPPRQCKIRMITDQRWKLVQFELAPPLLFDRINDPQELINLAGDSAHKAILEDMMQKLLEWALNPQSNICMPDEAARAAMALLACVER